MFLGEFCTLQFQAQKKVWHMNSSCTMYTNNMTAATLNIDST